MDERDGTQAIWQVWAETGGTFTDCIAVDPSGGSHRAKVLSSSRLRGTLVEAVGERRWRVHERWDAPADFVRGYPIWLMDDADHPAATIVTFDPSTKTIELDVEITAAQDTTFEVRFPYEAPILAARLVTRTLPDQPLPPIALRVATTRGTNALLTRRGSPPAFFVTAGFADLLAIGTQQRPDLFALDIVKPQSLTGAIVEVEERLSADGTILRPLNDEAVEAAARRLVAEGGRTAAVALMHSYRNPEHEQRVAAILRSAGFTHVSVSSELAPFIKLLPRAQTAVVNAYLAPILNGYLDGIHAELPEAGRSSTLHVMTSAGGLLRPDSFRAKDSLLSGPAGGIVGAARAGRRAGFERIIAFDMGGTSTDVARFDGEYDYVFEHSVGDATVAATALAIESVAAGGGSICSADCHGLRVGPESAGASPGAACYGAGGPLTITDVNLLLGRLSPGAFGIPVDVDAAAERADALVAQLSAETGEPPLAREELLEGFRLLADERMADAIRGVSLRRGYDPSEYALVAFGGAGAQHACSVAGRLGIATVIVPPDAGLLSAVGLRCAVIERIAERQLLRRLDSLEGEFAQLVAELSDQSIAAVAGEGVVEDNIEIRQVLVSLRFAGQESTLPIAWRPDVSLHDSFLDRYATVYGHRPNGRAIEVESVRVLASSRATPETAAPPVETASSPIPVSVTRTWFSGGWQETPVYDREVLSPGATIAGPALLREAHSAVVVEPGWTASVDGDGAVLLRPSVKSTTAQGQPISETVARELFAFRFVAIAEEMGEQLRRSSLSTNIRERLDFSCAVLDPEGNLVASAAHIPVHLGALGLCVRRLREVIPMEPGDVVITNHPAFGGSHLPDVTVVTPVFTAGLAPVLIGYVANRAHHAEIGGTRPGSMPPGATSLIEEGVVLAPMYLAGGGISHLETVCQRLESAVYPSRNVADNRADLEAAIAANRRGEKLLVEFAALHGTDAVRRQMENVTLRAERLLRSALAAMPDGRYAAIESLDDGSPIAVAITISGDSAHIDFTGTAPTHSGNLNAPPAVAFSAVLYVLRLLVCEPLPLNEGLLRAVTVHLPHGSLVNPSFDLDDAAHCPAVVGGNTETSQRIVDTLLKALGLAACSQGTMNNTLWGSDDFGYYETVCGGAGATANAPGGDAVHTHMTNTRITDPEIMETRYPVRIERFAIRRGSGGAGQHRGGDGVVRETVFLKPMSLSVLTQHRTTEPYGMAGGENGQPGRQAVLRAEGTITPLNSVDGCEVVPDDRLLLETPGGGGWGPPPVYHRV